MGVWHWATSLAKERERRERERIAKASIYKEFFKGRDIYVSHEFKKNLKLFPHGDQTQFAEYLFDFLNKDNDGIVSFEEYLEAISITCRGSLEEKLKCEFFILIFSKITVRGSRDGISNLKFIWMRRNPNHFNLSRLRLYLYIQGHSSCMTKTRVAQSPEKKWKTLCQQYFQW